MPLIVVFVLQLPAALLRELHLLSDCIAHSTIALLIQLDILCDLVAM
jgi:hypothetical protein